MTEGGYAPSRRRAQQMIESGCVAVDGRVIEKPSQSISEGEHCVQVRDMLRYVGRGGLKLEAALEAFSIDPSGKRALDVGSSTGGFTDCLLQNGAAHVCAVDAGVGQLAEKLRRDARVTSCEHMNARNLMLTDIGGERVDLIVMDVSFISATYILPRFPDLLSHGGLVVVLIKPQFEVGKSLLGKGGIVKDPRAHRTAVERVLDTGRTVGLNPIGLIASPIEGGDGNREFLACFSYASDESTQESRICNGVTPEEIGRVTGTRVAL